MIRKTSREAYHQIKLDGSLSRVRFMVYEALVHNDEATANELFKTMPASKRVNSNTVTRLGELRDMGVVEEFYERPCKVTGKTAIVWKVTNEDTPRELPKNLNPTAKELITALCERAEHVCLHMEMQSTTPLGWREWALQTRKIVAQCSKYRKKAKKNG